MSDTDDTDILLLIPPDFFRIRSPDSDDSFVDSARTVIKNRRIIKNDTLNNLIVQVKGLESRLGSLESSSFTDLNSVRYSSPAEIGTGDILRTPKTASDLNISLDSPLNHTFPRRKKRRIRNRRNSSHWKYSDSLGSQESRNWPSPTLSSTQRLSSTSYETVYKDDSNVARNLLSNSYRMKEVSHSLQLRSSTDKLLTMDEDNEASTILSEKCDDAPMLSEIDEFLNRVEMFERSVIHTAFENNDSMDVLSPQKHVCNDIEKSADSPKSYLHKYIYLTEDNANTHTSIYDVNKAVSNMAPTKKSQDVQGDIDKQNFNYISSYKWLEQNNHPQNEKLPAIRKLQFPDTSNGNTVTSTPNEKVGPNHQEPNFGSPIKSRVQERAEMVLDMHRKMMTSEQATLRPAKLESNRHMHSDNAKSLNASPVKKIDLNESSFLSLNVPTSHKESFSTNNNPDSTYDSLIKFSQPNALGLNLMSLADLWSNKSSNGDETNVVAKRKFEEERLKREHCESIIQQLQKKYLEQQQKIAVAIRIDKAKDEAINKLKDAWLRLSGSLTTLDSKHKSIMERMVNEMNMITLESRNNSQKSKQYEQELSKALDLAHDYQEKCKQITQSSKASLDSAQEECKQYVQQLEEKDRAIAELKDSHSSVVKLNKQFSGCVDKLENCIEKEKNQNEIWKDEVNTAKKRLDLLEEEVLQVKQNRDILKQKLEVETEKNSILHQDLNEANSKVKSFETEVQALKKQLETQKLDLKTFYQKQLEAAVLSKLKEFQSQLDEAERIMASDLADKQKSVAEAFAKQIQLLESEHKKEISKLEETQKDELKLYRLQLAQASQKIVYLEEKLQSYRNKRGQIASQLHQVMESQWQQALRILTAGANTPSAQNNQDREYQRNDNVDACQPRVYSQDDMSDIDKKIMSSLRSQSEPYLVPNFISETLPLRSRQEQRRNERRRERTEFTPLSSKTDQDRLSVLTDSDMQKYIKLLLSKSPTEVDSDNPQTDTTNKSDRYSPDSNYGDVDPKERPTSDKADDRRLSNGKSKETHTSSGSHNSLKPPWK